MQSGNLIPAARLEARHRRAHLRVCAAVCGAYAVAALLIAISCRLTWGGSVEAVQHNVDLVDEQLRLATHSAGRAAAEYADAQNELAIVGRIATQPDWSLLIASAAAPSGDSIVLKSIAMAPRLNTVPTNDPSIPVSASRGSPQRLVVSIAGVGDSRFAVSQYVVALEKAGLYSRVVELDSHKETFFGADAVSFRLECFIDEGTK